VCNLLARTKESRNCPLCRNETSSPVARFLALGYTHQCSALDKPQSQSQGLSPESPSFSLKSLPLMKEDVSRTPLPLPSPVHCSASQWQAPAWALLGMAELGPRDICEGRGGRSFRSLIHYSSNLCQTGFCSFREALLFHCSREPDRPPLTVLEGGSGVGRKPSGAQPAGSCSANYSLFTQCQGSDSV
jgi:hypothetical protein